MNKRRVKQEQLMNSPDQCTQSESHLSDVFLLPYGSDTLPSVLCSSLDNRYPSHTCMYRISRSSLPVSQRHTPGIIVSWICSNPRLKIVYRLVDPRVNEFVAGQGVGISATRVQLCRPPEARESLFLVLLERETVPYRYPRLWRPRLDREEFLRKK